MKRYKDLNIDVFSEVDVGAGFEDSLYGRQNGFFHVENFQQIIKRNGRIARTKLKLWMAILLGHGRARDY